MKKVEEKNHSENRKEKTTQHKTDDGFCLLLLSTARRRATLCTKDACPLAVLVAPTSGCQVIPQDTEPATSSCQPLRQLWADDGDGGVDGVVSSSTAQRQDPPGWQRWTLPTPVKGQWPDFLCWAIPTS